MAKAFATLEMVKMCTVSQLERQFQFCPMVAVSRAYGRLGTHLHLQCPILVLNLRQELPECLKLLSGFLASQISTGNGLRVKAQRVKTSENFSEESNLPLTSGPLLSFLACFRTAPPNHRVMPKMLGLKTQDVIISSVFLNIFCQATKRGITKQGVARKTTQKSPNLAKRSFSQQLPVGGCAAKTKENQHLQKRRLAPFCYTPFCGFLNFFAEKDRITRWMPPAHKTTSEMLFLVGISAPKQKKN